MYLRNLYPVPKSFSGDESRQYVFGSQVTGIINGLTAEQAERVKVLWRRFSCNASELTLLPGTEPDTFTVGKASAKLSEGDAYAISVTEAGIAVAGRDAPSLMKGMETLAQLICPMELAEGKESLYLSAAEVHDAPSIGFRAIHFCVFPDSDPSAIEKSIHLAGFLGMTHVILEFWGTFRYRCLPELSWPGRSRTAEEWKPLIDLIRSYGMEPIPMVNHFGHATQARGRFGRHVVLDQNPRLSRLFEPDGWTWCLSNPDTYRLLAEMRAEQLDFCGGSKYFHLGFDEAVSYATCPVCRRRKPHELLAEYLNRITEDVCRAGCRPIVWHDQFVDGRDFPAGVIASGQGQGTAPALDLLDRRIIMADWEYGYRKGFNPSTPYFMEKGFDTVVCPWDSPATIRSLSADAVKLGAYGILLTTWDHIDNYLSNAGGWANCVWNAKEGMEQNEGGWREPLEESACLLRRLYDCGGRFEAAGWSNYETKY